MSYAEIPEYEEDTAIIMVSSPSELQDESASDKISYLAL